MLSSRASSWCHSQTLMTFATLVLIAIGAGIWLGAASSLVPAVILLGLAVVIVGILPPAGIAAVLAALPTMYELHPMPRGQFTLLELAILVTATGTFFSILAGIREGGWDDLISLVVPPQVVVPVLLLVLAACVALLTIANPSQRAESLREVRTVIVEPLIFLATARIVLRDAKWRSWTGAAFIAVGAAVALYAVIQVTFNLGGVAAGSVLRATGPYTHPNNLALFLERTFLFTLAVIVLRPRWWPLWLLGAIQFVGVGMTYSRGALLAIAVAVSVLLLLLGMHKWLGVLALGGACVGGVAFLLAPDRILDAGGMGSEPTRFAVWRSSIRMAIDYPIFGVGPDQFLYQYWRRYVEPMGWPERFTSHPHSLLLDIWLRLGIAGLAAFATLIVGLTWWVRQTFASIRDDVWSMGAIVAIVGGLTHGMVDQGFFLPDLATTTWLFVAFLITTRAGAEVKDRFPSGDERAAVACTLEGSNAA